MGVTELTTPGNEGQTPNIRSLTRLLGAESTADGARGLPEYSAELPPGIDGEWGKRILGLGDSLSVQEIVRILYEEQLDRGAGLADLGTWKSYFDQSVMETIARLAGYGYLKAAPGGVLERRIELATTAKRKRTKTKERKAASDKSVEMTATPSQQAEMVVTSSPGTAQEWATAGGEPEPERHNGPQAGLEESFRPGNNGIGGPGGAGEAAPHLGETWERRLGALVARIVRRRLFGAGGRPGPESRAERG